MLDKQLAEIQRLGRAAMQMSLNNIVIQLVEGKHLAFKEAHGVFLECTEGMVWLTVEGQSGDFLLARGERLRIKSKGLALVQGLPSGSIRLSSSTIWAIRRDSRFDWRFEPSALLPRLVRANH